MKFSFPRQNKRKSTHYDVTRVFRKKNSLKLVDFGSLTVRLLRYLALSTDLALKFMALSFFDPNIKGHLLTSIQYNSSSIEASMYPINDKNFHLKNKICARGTCFANTRLPYFNKGGFSYDAVRINISVVKNKRLSEEQRNWFHGLPPCEN